MRPQQSVQQVSRVENYISNNQLNKELELMSGSKYGFDAHTIFYPYALKVFKLKKVRSLKLLLVVNIQTYVYGPSRALGKKH